MHVMCITNITPGANFPGEFPYGDRRVIMG